MRPLAGALLLDVAMTRKAEVAAGCLEKVWILCQMRVVAARAGPLGDCGVHVTAGEILLEITVTGVTELRTLDLQPHPGATWYAVAGVTRSLTEGRVLVVGRQHMVGVRPVRRVARATVRPAHRYRMIGVRCGRIVA